MVELFDGGSPARYFREEYARVTKRDLPPSDDVAGILRLTHLDQAAPDGLEMIDRIIVANTSYLPHHLGPRLIGSYFAFRPYLKLIERANKRTTTKNEDLLMKSILAVSSGQLLREDELCPTFRGILSQAFTHRPELVSQALSDMWDARIPYIDMFSELKLQLELVRLQILHK